MHKRVMCLVVAFGCGGGGGSSTDAGPGGGDGDHGTSTPSHDLGSCTVFPAATGSRDDYTYWNLDISGANPDSMSNAYISSMGMTTKVHPDFGSDPSYGIPFDTVPGSQAKVTMSFDQADESDPGPYPYPADAPIEAGSDGHVLIVDRDNCVLYETGNSVYTASSNSWAAYSGAVFNLKTGTPLRPETWTSADASGGPILIGLARYEEVMSGTIDHALRFTANTTQKAYIHPATHEAGSTSTAGVPPMWPCESGSSPACVRRCCRARARHIRNRK